MSDIKNTAEAIVRDMEADIRDRRGLKREWAAIDADVVQEIRAAWCAIVHKHVEQMLESRAQGDLEEKLSG